MKSNTSLIRSYKFQLLGYPQTWRCCIFAWVKITYFYRAYILLFWIVKLIFGKIRSTIIFYFVSYPVLFVVLNALTSVSQCHEMFKKNIKTINFIYEIFVLNCGLGRQLVLFISPRILYQEIQQLVTKQLWVKSQKFCLRDHSPNSKLKTRQLIRVCQVYSLLKFRQVYFGEWPRQQN